jgi:hypothetical protein
MESMPPLPPGMAAGDTAMFDLKPPVDKTAQAAKKKQQDELKKRDAEMRKKQMEMTEKLIETTKDEDTAEERASLVRKIHAYNKKFSEKLKGMNITQAKGQKATIEELRQQLSDIEHELGKSGGIELAAETYVGLMKTAEQVHYGWNPLKLKLAGLGQVTEDNHEKLVDLLEEFAIKHEKWFSQSVEVRILAFTAMLIRTVHSANLEAEIRSAQKAQQAPAPANLQDLKNKI